ncbi:MAG TPA: tetratricopeptide repeat-containing protein [Ktedonobacteraceae bacterium]|nr:tetratricopeptide repeat-containing protein [Ktedonobacteraceae bacterium]
MEASRLKIFISHHHNDKDLAGAWRKLIEAISAHQIEVWYASDVRPERGVAMGRNWHEQLYQQLSECHFVIALQTLANYNRPWVMWECGLASGVNRARGIIPIVYGIERDELRSPLSIYQGYDGEKPEQIQEVCQRLLKAADIEPHHHSMSRPLRTYMATISSFRPRKWMSIEQMDMWLNQFKELEQTGRASEVIVKLQLMYSSYMEPFQPVKAELHGWLCKTLLKQRCYKEALQEADYALQLDRDNTEWLYHKALALVELQNLQMAEDLLQAIFAINADLKANQEIASLAGRIYRERWLLTEDQTYLEAAFQVYYEAYQANKRLYFPGINAAELALTKGDLLLAGQILREVLETCKRFQAVQVVSFWADFTAGQAYLGLGEVKLALVEYQRGLGRNSPPSPRDRESAVKGAVRMATAKKLPETAVEAIRTQLLAP